MTHRYLLATAAILAVAGCGKSEPAKDKAPAADVATSAPDTAAPATSASYLYPGAAAGGAADHFASADPPDKVAGWYADPARRNEMIYASTEKRDDGHLVIGTAGENGASFALLLKPGSNGGTDIQIIPYDPKKGLKL